MDLQNTIANFYNGTDKRFCDLFIQLFVESTGGINYRFFNEVYESKFTHAEINKAIEAVNGSKFVKFTEPDNDLTQQSIVFSLFKREYKFGKYQNARLWIKEVYDNTEMVLPRQLVLGWIAKQRPDRVTSSFAPVNDGNLYHATEKESFSKPNKRTDAEITE